MSDYPDVIRKARTQLVLRHPFFATLVLGMEMQEVPKGAMRCDTMGTDGKRIFYVREWAEKLTLEEMMGILAHEALHAALLHPFRTKTGNFQPDKANIAQDLAINGHLVRDGFVLPGKPVTWDEMLAGGEGHLLDKQFYDKAFEEIYRFLKDPPEQPKCPAGGEHEDNDGDGKCDKCGAQGQQGKGHLGKRFEIKGGRKGIGNDVIPNDSPSDETEAKINVQKAATVARSQGKLPSGMEGILKDLLEPKISWYDVLRHLMKSKRKDDYDPRRYNRRMTLFDVYLPTLYSEGMGPMVVVRDTSGSCMGDQEKFLTELASIMAEVKPDKLYLLDCDAGIREDSVKEFNYNEGDRLIQEAKTFYGGGGTSFVPPFNWVKEKNLRPEVLVYLTDMYGDFPTSAPGYPVMWVSTSDIKQAPFGTCLPIE